jgi:cell wall-associated NlpC family hydrolase
MRPITAAVLAISLGVASFAAAGTAAARPSKQDLAAAKAKLDALNQHLSLLVEDYNQANIALQKAEASLAASRLAMQHAQATQQAARAQLSARAAQAYEGAGSQIDILLGAQSLAQFSDRLEFLNTIAQNDTDTANRAQTAGQQAHRASEDLAKAVAAKATALKSIGDEKALIVAGIADQQALVHKYQIELAKPVVKKVTPAVATGSDGSVGSGSGGGGAPPPSSRAGIAVQAAFSVIGTPYVWGGSSPQTGFDCSGLTMWSWAQAGVGLPHSAADQYAVLPHVDRSELQPGDLLFFYTPISHVAIYVGGGMVIEAHHPGTSVMEDAPDWASYVGAGRPS